MGPKVFGTLVMLALIGCGPSSANEPHMAENSLPPTHDVAIVIPEAEGGRVPAGTIVELVYPGGDTRGYRHYLQRWDDEAWADIYQVFISDPRQPYDRERIEGAWAPARETRMKPSIGFQGSQGGQFTVIPPPTASGTYRVCDERGALCSAAFEVTD
jgi:hypothetical protein